MITEEEINERMEKEIAVEKRLLLKGYQRVLREIEAHQKQKDTKKYLRMMQAYGDGIDEFTLSPEAKGPIQTVYERKLAETIAEHEAETNLIKANLELTVEHIKAKSKAKRDAKRGILDEAESKAKEMNQ